MYASNSTRFKQAYSDIAERVELPGRNNGGADILRLVFNWLCDERNGRWFMILDNVDDPDVLFARGGSDMSRSTIGEEALANFIPQSANGRILITSRNSRAASQLLDIGDVNIKIEPMGEKEALTLCRTRLEIPSAIEPDAVKLVKALDYIPLAISQSCAYIRVKRPRLSISRYLELFLQSEKNQEYLLKSADMGDVRRDQGVPHGVFGSWQISFNQIRERNPGAADLLSFMCVIDRQGIPESLLRDNANDFEFEEQIRPLLDFSLIRMQSDKRIFEMHRLVQRATKIWLDSHDQLVRYQRKALKRMARLYPTGDYENWEACEELLPHSRVVLTYTVERKDDVIDYLKLLHNTGVFIRSRGEYEVAEAMFRQEMEQRNQFQGEEHIDTLYCMDSLSIALCYQGNFKEAEIITRKTTEKKKMILGKSHPGTLASSSNLAAILSNQGKSKEAEKIFRNILQQWETVLGKQHPDTLNCQNHLSESLCNQGKFEEAEIIHRKILKIREEVLGKDHPDTLQSVNNLALTLQGQGKLGEAEMMIQKAVNQAEKILGKEHPDTLWCLKNLAEIYHGQRKYRAAVEHYQRAYDGQRRVFGDRHPETASTLKGYSIVRAKLKNMSEPRGSG